MRDIDIAKKREELRDMGPAPLGWDELPRFKRMEVDGARYWAEAHVDSHDEATIEVLDRLSDTELARLGVQRPLAAAAFYDTIFAKRA